MTFLMFILCAPSPIMPFILALMQKSPPGWRQSWVAMSTFYYLNVQHPQLVAMERDLVEFLSRQEGTRLETKLQRINCFTVLAMREAEHQKMQRLREQGWYPSNSEALKTGDGGE